MNRKESRHKEEKEKKLQKNTNGNLRRLSIISRLIEMMFLRHLHRLQKKNQMKIST